MSEARKILVLGASGLIGRFVTDDLRARGFHVVGIARRFSPSQKASALDLELPAMSMDAASLARLIGQHGIDLVVNCLGVLQDGPGSDTRAVHRDFVARLLQAIRDSGRAMRLVHISIPGAANDDRTAFSATKREAEWLIAASGIPYAILRPGFVIAASIAWLAGHDPADKIANAATWDLMQPQPVTLGGVIEQFRRSFGTADMPRITLPAFMLDLGAKLGDLANWLGWMPPMRTTAITELRRGVTGDPHPWMDETGIVPRTLRQAVGQRSATIQDKWFARLFLIKALAIASLVVFWIASGFIALVISYDAAAAILTARAFPPALVAPFTVGTSLIDMTIGVLIAFRRTCAFGLIAGIVASLGYMLGTAILTPDLWIEPLGALVKTGPAIVLMLVALLTLDNR